MFVNRFEFSVFELYLYAEMTVNFQTPKYIYEYVCICIFINKTM